MLQIFSVFFTIISSFSVNNSSIHLTNDLVAYFYFSVVFYTNPIEALRTYEIFLVQGNKISNVIIFVFLCTRLYIRVIKI